MPNVLLLSMEERRVREAIGMVSDELQLTDQERAETIPSGSETLISSRVQWALTYLVQAGLISRPRRAHFVITEQGRSTLDNDLGRLNLAHLKTGRKPAASQPEWQTPVGSDVRGY
ncbi:MAG: winged helix-turn-helix domain-containing protein [Paracoccaceae bacterium]